MSAPMSRVDGGTGKFLCVHPGVLLVHALLVCRSSKRKGDVDCGGYRGGFKWTAGGVD